MQDPYLASVLKAIEEDALEPDGPRLITVQQLEAAGALDVPPAWRKSLSAGTKPDASAEPELPLFANLQPSAKE